MNVFGYEDAPPDSAGVLHYMWYRVRIAFLDSANIWILKCTMATRVSGKSCGRQVLCMVYMLGSTEVLIYADGGFDGPDTS